MGEMDKGTIALGFDPGKDGALAILGWRVEPVVVPFGVEAYVEALRKVMWFDRDNPPYTVRAVVEHVGAMPGQGVTSCFSFGQNFGTILGMLAAFGVPYELVRPARWKREFGCTSDKNTSIEVAKRLFPGVSLKRTERCTKDHDGLAEALLMAEFCRRRMV